MQRKSLVRVKEDNTLRHLYSLGIMCLWLVCSCEDEQAASGAAKALPEDPRLCVSGSELEHGLIQGARDYCDEMRTPIARMCRESAVPLGQLRLVEQRLEQPRHHANDEPLCVFATTGTAGTGGGAPPIGAFPPR